MARLTEKLNQQEVKIKQLELTCGHQATTIQQLNNTVSTQKADIVNLNEKLREKEKLLLNTWPNNVMNGHSYDSEHCLHFEDHNNTMSSSSSQDSVLSNDNFECGPPPIVVTQDGNEQSSAVRESNLSPNEVWYVFVPLPYLGVYINSFSMKSIHYYMIIYLIPLKTYFDYNVMI